MDRAAKRAEEEVRSILEKDGHQGQPIIDFCVKQLGWAFYGQDMPYGEITKYARCAVRTAALTGLYAEYGPGSSAKIDATVRARLDAFA